MENVLFTVIGCSACDILLDMLFHENYITSLVSLRVHSVAHSLVHYTLLVFLSLANAKK